MDVINTSSCNRVVCNPVGSPHMKYHIRHQRLYRQHKWLPLNPQCSVLRKDVLYHLYYQGSSAGWAKSIVHSMHMHVCMLSTPPGACGEHAYAYCVHSSVLLDPSFRDTSISAISSLVLALRSFVNVFSAFSVLCILANHLQRKRNKGL